MTDQPIQTPELPEPDLELLSAYIDNMLDDDDRAALEARLSEDVALRRELAALRQTVQLIRALPDMTAPRNFTVSLADVQPAPEGTQARADATEAQNGASAAITPLPRRNRWRPLLTLAATFATVFVCFAATLSVLQGGIVGTFQGTTGAFDQSAPPPSLAEPQDDSAPEPQVALMATQLPTMTTTPLPTATPQAELAVDEADEMADAQDAALNAAATLTQAYSVRVASTVTAVRTSTPQPPPDAAQAQAENPAILLPNTATALAYPPLSAVASPTQEGTTGGVPPQLTAIAQPTLQVGLGGATAATGARSDEAAEDDAAASEAEVTEEALEALFEAEQAESDTVLADGEASSAAQRTPFEAVQTVLEGIGYLWQRLLDLAQQIAENARP